MGLDPISWAVIGATAIGGGVSAYSQHAQGVAAQKLDNYNASLMQQQAATTQRDAAISANAQRAQNERIMARQRAGFAASGAVSDTGSPLLVEAQQAGFLEMNALETQRRGRIEAGKYEQQATLDTMQGSAARKAGNLNAWSTVLQTGTKALGQYAGVA